jgi:hypothetical protein
VEWCFGSAAGSAESAAFLFQLGLNLAPFHQKLLQLLSEVLFLRERAKEDRRGSDCDDHRETEGGRARRQRG